jgi:regulator of sigma E protease
VLLTSVVGVVVLLGGLIFFHELGHYSVAKLFGVKVEVFSLGFGKKLFRRTIGETEYALSLFPLGGYVKLMGDDPYKGVPAHEAARAFCTQKLYKRFLIVAAGPLANLLLAYVLFTAVFWAGKPVAGTKIGSVIVASPAWEAGLRNQDRILSINSQPVKTWTDMEDMLRPMEGRPLELQVDRAGTEMRIPMTASRVRLKNVYGEDEEVGGIKGIAPNPLDPMVGVSNPDSAAYLAGVRSGDTIVKIGARTVTYFDDLNEILEKEWEAGKPVALTVKRPVEGDLNAPGKEMSFTLTFPKRPAPEQISALGISEALGLYPSELFVYQVTPASPAEQGGMLAGDRIVKIGDTPIYNFETIVDAVQLSGGKDQAVAVQLERAGKPVTITVKPTETTREDPITRQPVKKFMLGFAPRAAYHEPDIVKLQVREPVALVKKAVGEVNLLAQRMVVSLWKLVVGQISVKNLGGPVLIASVAGKSLDAGIVPFLQMMALISINLFLLNLFPVPILDGGHLLFFAIEAVKGKPVSIRTMEIANQIGMVFILMLVGLTLFNDISRIVMH